MCIDNIIILSLLTSFLGGLYSAIIVMRKTIHDNKRRSANQMYGAFYSMYQHILFTTMHYLEWANIDIEFRSASIRNIFMTTDYTSRLQNRYEDWYKKGRYKDLKSHGMKQLEERCYKLIEDMNDNAWGLNDFFTKYSIPVSYFDNLYKLLSISVELKQAKDSLEEQKYTDFDHIYATLGTKATNAVSILSEVILQIEHYKEAKSWRYHLFIPIMKI